MIKKKRDSMQEYVHRLVEPIFNEALKDTIGVSKDGGSVRLYWRPNNYRLKIPFNKLTFKEHTPKRTSFPMEVKISNYGSKFIGKITRGETIVIDKESVTCHYSLKDDRGKKLYNEVYGSIEDFEDMLNKGVESIKNKMFLRLKEIIRCYGGIADFENADWLRYEDGNIGDEFCDSLPENRIIFANTFKKVYKDEIEFTGKKGEHPTYKLVNYIDNQALERRSPEILNKLDNIQNERVEFNKAMLLFTDQLKGFGVEIKEHRGVVKDMRKYLRIIAGFKQKKMKITENQTDLSKFIHNNV